MYSMIRKVRTVRTTPYSVSVCCKYDTPASKLKTAYFEQGSEQQKKTIGRARWLHSAFLLHAAAEVWLMKVDD
eukprot:scaffold2080_cov121-Skeletonema_menzelii.AAC.7